MDLTFKTDRIEAIMKIISALTLGVATSISGCAKPPSTIPHISVASSEYEGLSCSQLADELASVSTRLETAESSQRIAVAFDTALVYLTLFPPSSMIGDSASDVGRYKGEKIAVERMQTRLSCGELSH